MPERHLTTSGRALHTQHGPELHTYFIGAHHMDGSLISLSHFYPSVTVILADISGIVKNLIIFLFILYCFCSIFSP